ncbi:hypothetical protein DCS_00974 [Drechmeria coniospora]|uniref:Uncharacterized protein n=1 Tax=Drechmeria coniospora TaxID=98403 RepID=A0A151GRX3_DRECN|nr:hypothetical protein DCS_00974 [Drechmeria coniospora]KYK59840.1 hypothetical protein DCS_00974 [Drechmeria coniospora]
MAPWHESRHQPLFLLALAGLPTTDGQHIWARQRAPTAASTRPSVAHGPVPRSALGVAFAWGLLVVQTCRCAGDGVALYCSPGCRVGLDGAVALGRLLVTFSPSPVAAAVGRRRRLPTSRSVAAPTHASAPMPAATGDHRLARERANKTVRLATPQRRARILSLLDVTDRHPTPWHDGEATDSPSIQGPSEKPEGPDHRPASLVPLV